MFPGYAANALKAAYNPVIQGVFCIGREEASTMREVGIAEAVRTPVGRRNGALKDVHPVVLGAMALRELMDEDLSDAWSKMW